ncbi:acyl-CoA synthetase family member 2, mitochondrial-like isoform X2 [Dendronephthya gigantea]|uniref:acyl-CoA synthetase family member 2, mitochondrial-like isoform X2 n=1 Tax=Dendronephthya gigantea TaxID=151771 RepID=UPI00106D2B2B|nr:acyl-CoA synthetase family member 2, mitochondrial-like isoform X2 [Dendronephthya gigantea]
MICILYMRSNITREQRGSVFKQQFCDCHESETVKTRPLKRTLCLHIQVLYVLKYYCAIQPLTSHSPSDKLSYFCGPSGKPFLGSTIGQVVDQAAELYPDRDAYVFCENGRKATFSDLKFMADKLAAGFLALGLKRGDRVGIWGPNVEEWILTQFATAKAGLILVNINPAYRAAEAHYALKKVGCKALVSVSSHKTSDYYGMLCEIAPELHDSKPGWLHSEHVPMLRQVIMIGDENYSGTLSFNEVIQAGGNNETEELNALQQRLQFDDPISIQFTSGTTGNPKGVTLSHHNILNNAFLVGSTVKYAEEHSKICIPVPLYHCFGMVLGSLSSVIFGATAVYPSSSFDARTTLAACQAEKCTSLYGTPTMFIDMLSEEDLSQFDLNSLRTGVMGGSQCHIEIMKAVMDKLHLPELTLAYGLTELSPLCCQTQIDDPVELRVSTVGKMHSNTEGKIVNENGEIIPVGEDGELCVRGYCVMLGYWDDEDKTKSTIDASGWLHTGDKASMDEDGYVRIVGRMKDLIIRGGENIYPAEIEQFLYHHSKIQEVEVIGVPDKRMGEEICAWIRLIKDETATADEIKEFCKGKIAHFKIPRYIKFVDDMPMTVTGKVKKYVMREISAKELKLE